ncbi:hypothetical protein BRC92_00390 [Halobacteriales archaeon QS_4_69_31]|nr:MAG: hypothetical protein BRC92_00390 [Halobacteriales archaeon QS_4_69_31]
MTQVEPATHEADATLYYAPVETHPNALVDYSGLDPYWYLADLLISHVDGGYHELETEIDGEHATIRLTYSRSGIRPAREHDVASDRLYEFDVNVQLDGQRKVNYNVSPRFEDMRDSDGEEISTPWDHTDPEEGLAVRVQSSNVALDELPELLPRALHELSEDLETSMWTGYFQQPFDGRLIALERYVRIRRELQETLVRTGGVMDRLASHLSDTAGTAGSREWDNQETRGHYHTLHFDSSGARALVDRHCYGGQIKSYLPREPESFEPSDPLYHPKVGSKFVAGRTDTGSVDWSDRHDVVDELDERLLSVLSWSEISTEAGGTTYVADDHFSAGATESSVPLHRDPLPELDAREDLQLVDALQSMTPSHRDMVQELATDGGRDVQELAADTDTSESTVYRMLDAFEGVLESDAGHVQWVSASIREKIRETLGELDDHLDAALERVGRLVDLDQYQRASSAFEEWLADHAAEFRQPSRDGGRPVVEIKRELTRRSRWSDLPDVVDVLEEMLDAWARDGRDRRELLDAKFVASVDGDRRERFVWSEVGEDPPP